MNRPSSKDPVRLRRKASDGLPTANARIRSWSKTAVALPGRQSHFTDRRIERHRLCSALRRRVPELAPAPLGRSRKVGAPCR